MDTNTQVGQVGTLDAEKVVGKVGQVPRTKPTREDAEKLGELFGKGTALVNKLTKSIREFREYLGPVSHLSNEDGVQKVKNQLSEVFENFIEEFIEVREEIQALPAGTTPPGWGEGYDARAASVSVLCGKIGSNLDAIVTPAAAKKAMTAAYPKA